MPDPYAKCEQSRRRVSAPALSISESLEVDQPLLGRLCYLDDVLAKLDRGDLDARILPGEVIEKLLRRIVLQIQLARMWHLRR